MNSSLPKGLTKLLFLISAVFISGAIITPVLDKLIRVPFDLDNRGTSLFLIVNALAHLFGPMIGIISDRLGKRVPFLVVGLVGSGLILMTYPWITSYPLLLSLRFAEGVLWIGALTILFSRALDITPSDMRGKAMGIISFALPMAYLTGPILAGILADNHMELLFFLVGLAIVFGGFTLLADWKLEVPPCQLTATFGDNILLLFREPRLLLPLIFGFIDKLTIGLIAMLSLVLADRFGVKEVSAVSLLMVVFWISYIAGCLPTGRLSGKGFVYPLLFGGSALYGFALILMGFVPLGGFYFLLALAGVMSAVMFIPSLVLIGQFTTPKDRGTAMGLYNLFGTVGMTTGFAVMGILSNISYALAFTVAGSLELVAAVLGGILVGSGLMKSKPQLSTENDVAFGKPPSEIPQQVNSVS